MKLLDAQNAADYLRATGRVGATEPVTVHEMSGGVSNVVLYVTRPAVPNGDFVLKQAREQLRTPQAWFCTVERIWREVEVLRKCHSILRAGEFSSSSAVSAEKVLIASTPEVLFEDREHFCFAMTAAPPTHRVWKQDLLSGVADRQIAAACGRLLGRIHAGSWLDAHMAAALGERRLFDDLRIDPYYRTVARVHPDLQPAIERLIASVWNHACCLTHADFSPKNLLVYPQEQDFLGLMMVDFETGHFGDPAFDLGFFLTHLVLKAFYHAPDEQRFLELTPEFWAAYRQELRPMVSAQELQALEERAIKNFAGCALARLDGKSRVEYLQDENRRSAVRRLCRLCLLDELGGWSEVLAAVALELKPTV